MTESTSNLIIHRLDEMTERLQALDESIRGNGKPGLTQRVALIELKIGAMTAALLALVPVAVDAARRLVLGVK